MKIWYFEKFDFFVFKIENCSIYIYIYIYFFFFSKSFFFSNSKTKSKIEKSRYIFFQKSKNWIKLKFWNLDFSRFFYFHTFILSCNIDAPQNALFFCCCMFIVIVDKNLCMVHWFVCEAHEKIILELMSFFISRQNLFMTFFVNLLISQKTVF